MTRRPFLPLLAGATLLCALAAPALAQTDGLSALEAFLKNTQQGKTAFTQVVQSPPRAGETAGRRKTSSGTFEFQRPDRFRFVYTRPFEQTIVADGTTLWLYDADLNQVTARPQAEVLGQTPAALIAATPDLKGLDRVFTLSNAAPEPGARDGLAWVQAQPRQRDGQLQQVRLGFRQGQLAALDMLDSFGQRSTLTFEAMDTAPGFKPGHFDFKPPPGAEVVRP